MPIVEYDENKVVVDEDSFLVNFEEWNEKIAHVLAKKEGQKTLTEDQLDILKFMREYYRKYNFFPILRYVCKNVLVHGHNINRKYL